MADGLGMQLVDHVDDGLGGAGWCRGMVSRGVRGVGSEETGRHGACRRWCLQ